MKYTNRLNLPGPVVNAITNDPYSHDSDISVSGLIMAPKQRLLASRHDDQIVEDVADQIYALLGTSVHYILDMYAQNHPKAIAEKRLYTSVAGWKVSGKPDLIEDGVLSDYKVTSVWSVMDGVKVEWEQQLNLYAALALKNNISIDRIQNVAILRDWQRAKASREQDYPQSNVVVMDVPLWRPSDGLHYLEGRVKIHQSYMETPRRDPAQT